MNQTGSSWAYSVKEDKEILRYILDGQYQEIYKGDRLWKQMEKHQVCRSRTWQSLKNRFMKYIIRHIKQPLYELTAEEIDSIRFMRPPDQLKTKSSATLQSPNPTSYVGSSRQGTNVKQNSFENCYNDEVSQNLPDTPTSNVCHKRQIYHDTHEPVTTCDLTKEEELKTFQSSGKVLNSSAPDACREISLQKLRKAKKKGKEPDQISSVKIHVKTEKNDDSNSSNRGLMKTQICEEVNDAAVQVKTEFQENYVGNSIRPVKNKNNDNLSDQIQVNLEPDQHISDSNTDSVSGINTLRVGNSSNCWLSRDTTQKVTKRKGGRSRQKKDNTIPKDFYSLDLSCSDSDTT
ncbi:uncharacterized protein [Euwallacea fornicatus]